MSLQKLNGLERNRLMRCLLLSWLVILSGCHGRHRHEADSEAPCLATPTDRIACEYVRLALALGERDPDSLDFAVVSSERLSAAAKSYVSLEEIAQRAHTLREKLQALPPAQGEPLRSRRRGLALQLASVETRAAILRGQRVPFDVEAQELFHTARLPDAGQLGRRHVRLLIAHALHEEKSVEPAVAGSLAERYAAYDRHFVVPPDRLRAVMQAALTACREQTLKFLPLPPGEGVDLTFVRNQPWSAFSRFRGQGRSTISVNLDLPVTIDEVLDLACHEGYPGHHVFNMLREQALLAGRHLPEASVQLTFSPQSYVSEAAAAFAPELAFSVAERLHVERDLLFPLAGFAPLRAERYVRINSLVRELDAAEPAIARDYLDGRLEFVRAEQALASEVLMAHAEASLLYLNEYRSYMLAYTDGRRRVAALVKAAAGNSCTPPAPRAAQTRAAQTRAAQACAREWAAYTALMREFVVQLPGLLPSDTLPQGP